MSGSEQNIGGFGTRRDNFDRCLPRRVIPLDLTEDEARALTKHLRRTIDEDRFPHAPRHDPLKAILAKVEPPEPHPEPSPPLTPAMEADARSRTTAETVEREMAAP